MHGWRGGDFWRPAAGGLSGAFPPAAVGVLLGVLRVGAPLLIPRCESLARPKLRALTGAPFWVAVPFLAGFPMEQYVWPILLFASIAAAMAAGMLAAGFALGPKRTDPVKRMPYESGMDPVHAARRRFDVRFHVVAIAFLLFDVELLFLYPWAVASKHPEGFSSLAAEGLGPSRALMFGELLVFMALLTAAFVYAWRRGVFRWR